MSKLLLEELRELMRADEAPHNARDGGMIICEARWMTFWSMAVDDSPEVMFAADISFGHLVIMEPTTELDVDMIAARLADTDRDMGRGLLLCTLQDSLPGRPPWLEESFDYITTTKKGT